MNRPIRQTTGSHAKASEDNGRIRGTGAAPVTGDASRPNVGGGTDEADRDAGHMPTCALTPRDVLTVGNHSQMDGGAIAAVKGQARPASVVDAESSPSCLPNMQRVHHARRMTAPLGNISTTQVRP